MKHVTTGGAGAPSTPHKYNPDRDIITGNTAFLPTHEWKPILPGQILPAGLHIKIDVQTGAKMARLMEQHVGIRLPSEVRHAREARLIEQAAGGTHPIAHCKTSRGALSIELRFDWAPIGAGRLLALMEDGFLERNVFCA